MKDIYGKINGHFKVECLNSLGNTFDQYEEDNLIMDSARVNMAEAMAGLSGGVSINQFVLGTKGHVESDLLTPKTSVDGFVSSRTRLFSEETSDFHYSIVFTPTDSTDADATNIIESDTGSTIHITTAGSTITYLIVIPIGAANSSGTVAYTEAALYAGGDIFSMKTFAGKVKDDTVSLRITWSISF